MSGKRDAESLAKVEETDFNATSRDLLPPTLFENRYEFSRGPLKVWAPRSVSGEQQASVMSKYDEDSSRKYAIKLSDNIFMFANRTVGQHDNVYEGGVRSSVYGVRPCVIKFATISEQNVREAEILTKLSHTNVIAIIQSGTYCDVFEDRVYIALDKCHNENLRQYLANRKAAGIEFDLDQAIDFAKQMIVGVMYIHNNNVIHLDLKPSNILISQNLRLIKIADFGLSIVVKSPKSKVFHKRPFGTNGYRPVESFGNADVSMKTDIFSLGTVLLHLLSNGNDVFGRDEHTFIHNVINDITDTSGLLVGNPATTEHLIKCMVSKERRRRPTIWEVSDHPCWSGKEVGCDFEYFADDEIEVSEIGKREDVEDVKIKTVIDKVQEILQDNFNESHDQKAEAVKESTQTFVDQPWVPYKEKTAKVGPLGETFNVGGCTVFFPPQCFDKIQKVTVSAKIDPREWPPGKAVIAPCLDIKATNLKKYATITFTSWCVRDNEVGTTVEILHYEEETGKWEVIHTGELESSRSVTFKCKNFSPILPAQGEPALFAMAPRVYIFEQNFAVAVMLDQKLAIKGCLEMVKYNFGVSKVRMGILGYIAKKFKNGNRRDNIEKLKMSPFTCKTDSAIESNLFCSVPEEGFRFGECRECKGGECDCGRFRHDVNDIVKTAQASVRKLALRSEQNAANIILKCQIIREKDTIRNDDIRHYWNPDADVEITSLGTTSQSQVSNAGQSNSSEYSTTSQTASPSTTAASSTAAASRNNREEGKERNLSQIIRGKATIRKDDTGHNWHPTGSCEVGMSSSGTASLSEYSNTRQSSPSHSSSRPTRLSIAPSAPSSSYGNREEGEDHNLSHDREYHSTTESDSLSRGQPATGTMGIASNLSETSAVLTQSLTGSSSAVGRFSGVNLTKVEITVGTLNYAPQGTNKHYSDLVAHTVNEGTANIHKDNVEEHIHPKNTSPS